MYNNIKTVKKNYKKKRFKYKFNMYVQICILFYIIYRQIYCIF